ncbi:MAG TPA: hypothetical protein VHB99_04090, partial [Pirellulales bacterium]|nr:hypothetical protein [Pirellulales bacterium]
MAVRARLAAQLCELIDRIEVFTDGHAAAYDPDTRQGDDIRETIEAIAHEDAVAWARGPHFKDFLAYVAARR